MSAIDQINQGGTTYEIVPEIAELFSIEKTYRAGDHVIYEAGWYTFKTDKYAGAWDATKVDGPFKVTNELSSLKSELEVTSSYNIAWSQGGINNSGTAVSRTNRIRTDYIVIENDSIFVEIPSGFKYAIHAYDTSKTRIGYIPNGSDIMTDRKATYKVSDSYANAVYFRMWVAYADDSDILPAEGANVTVAPYESVIDTLKSHVLKSVRILGVGNSYTRDSIRWLCKILNESGYENVVVGHGYLGASTLADQYATLDSADSNHSAFEYWKYSNTKNAVKTSGKTLDEIFTDEPWDIVVFQQQSDESGQYASYVSSSFDINDFITYISGKVSNADVKYGLMMPWSHSDGYISTKFAEYYNSDPKAMLDAIKTVIPQVADHMSQCDYVVNAGEAIDLGRQNSYLNALGDQMLRTDKNHLYYGIPSYMVGLVYALTLCDVNLNNVMWYPTATDEGQTGITTSGYLAYLAKQCAETAANGYVLADDISELKEDLTATNAEVTDIRVGADGTTYNSAGAAVRGQYTELNDNVSKIENTLGGIITIDDLTTTNCYIQSDGTLYYTTLNISCSGMYPTIGLDKLHIVRSPRLSGACSIAFYTDDIFTADNFVSGWVYNGVTENLDIAIPNTAKYVAFCSRTNEGDFIVNMVFSDVLEQIQYNTNELDNMLLSHKGEYISFLGDSITSYLHYIPSGNNAFYPVSWFTGVERTWWYKLIQKTQMTLLINNSSSGSHMATNDTLSGLSRCENLDDGTNEPDHIIVYMGINDFANGNGVVGECGLNENTYSVDNFSDAYYTALASIKTKYPAAKLYLGTIMQYALDVSFPNKKHNVYLTAFNDAIHKLADIFGAEVIEFDKCGIDYFNNATTLGDALHPNYFGHDLMFKEALKHFIF